MEVMNNFKALIIEASAGTGKTHWITNQFIQLIGKENPASDIRRMLAVTFSEKAAIEMKSRILEKIYAELFPQLSEHKQIETENAMLRASISTLHSFCKNLLRRFAFYREMDPFFTVIDDRQSTLLTYMAFNRFLSDTQGIDILPMLKSLKMETLKKFLFSIIKTHPYATVGSPEGELSENISILSRQVATIKSEIKRELSFLDFDDLEIITYNILTESPESLIILEDFDERYNFIFVDEFQDTNILQWRIVYKFVEDWLAGYGAKAEKGKPYGIFLVGDRKQSIYKFRGAEGKVFDEAKKALKDYYKEEKLGKNHRSSPVIIEFVNKVFEGISPWEEEKLSPELQIPGSIEINFIECEKDKKAKEKAKEKEYQWVIEKIKKLVSSKQEIYDRKTGNFRPVNFQDIAILIRQKVGKKFPVLERCLKEAKIPFVILGGVGFYKEPEISFILSLIFALTDPTDGVSLWNLQTSSYGITPDKVYNWREFLEKEEIVDVIERILAELNFWDGLNTQQKANIEKLLMILDEWKSIPLYTIAHNLRTMMLSAEEAKADIFSEHQNAVRVLTIHNAKGLEFPVVFLVNVEDGKVNLTDDILYRKTEEGGPPYKFVLKKEADKEYEESFKDMLKEEELRVLYVALTRACQYLFISGVKEGKSIWMELLEKFAPEFPAVPPGKTSFVEEIQEKIVVREYIPKINYGDILTSYTEEKEKTEYHYEGTLLGNIAHKLMYEISEGRIKNRKEYEERVNFYLKKTYFENKKKMKEILMKIYENMEKNLEVMEIVSKNEKGKTFSELPFAVEIGGKIYTGFIDRVILVDKESALIYDYKVEESKPEKFKEQMDIYENAVRSIFPDRKVVKRFVIFLKKGIISEI